MLEFSRQRKWWWWWLGGGEKTEVTPNQSLAESEIQAPVSVVRVIPPGGHPSGINTVWELST